MYYVFGLRRIKSVREKWHLTGVVGVGRTGVRVGGRLRTHNLDGMIWAQCISIGSSLPLEQKPNPPLMGHTLLQHIKQRGRHCLEQSHQAATGRYSFGTNCRRVCRQILGYRIKGSRPLSPVFCLVKQNADALGPSCLRHCSQLSDDTVWVLLGISRYHYVLSCHWSLSRQSLEKEDAACDIFPTNVQNFPQALHIC